MNADNSQLNKLNQSNQSNQLTHLTQLILHVEQLLNQFYDIRTSNTEKKKIGKHIKILKTHYFRTSVDGN